EDGIRDFHVTGVQTCALPIYCSYKPVRYGTLRASGRDTKDAADERNRTQWQTPKSLPKSTTTRQSRMPRRLSLMRSGRPARSNRSEERRVGKAWRTGGWMRRG